MGLHASLHIIKSPLPKFRRGGGSGAQGLRLSCSVACIIFMKNKGLRSAFVSCCSYCGNKAFYFFSPHHARFWIFCESSLTFCMFFHSSFCHMQCLIFCNCDTIGRNVETKSGIILDYFMNYLYAKCNLVYCIINPVNECCPFASLNKC